MFNTNNIEQAVEGIWQAYDTDGSGTLEREEARNLMNEIIGTLDEETFNILFSDFDQDGSGTIDKPEMVQFIKL